MCRTRHAPRRVLNSMTCSRPSRGMAGVVPSTTASSKRTMAPGGTPRRRTVTVAAGGCGTGPGPGPGPRTSDPDLGPGPRTSDPDLGPRTSDPGVGPGPGPGPRPGPG